MSLKNIDFSSGIRAEEIQYNFNDLQDQLNRERKSVGGEGIASGLEITTHVTASDFYVELSEASIISKDGEEIHIPAQKIDIELPKLSKEIEYVYSNANNQVQVKHIPYSLDRRSTVETSKMFGPSLSGITIKYTDSIDEDDYIRVRNINGNTISLSGVTRRNLVITYNYTAKRIDTLYIDKDNNVKIISSTTSSSPSVMLPKEYKYLIAFIEVDGLYIDDDSNVYANILLKEDLRDIRNIYTDTYGELWLCGTPFKDLQILHLKEPKNPKENTLWYDEVTNRLKVWKATDKLIYLNEYIVTTDYSNSPEAAKDYPTDVYYYVGKNQLSIYVNDVQLDETQFCELLNGYPVSIQDIESNVMSNTFRILTELNIGDKIVYKISNFDKHMMWVPVNHSSYINAKEIKLFGPDSEPGYCNYYSSIKAIALGKDEENYPYKYQYFLFNRTEDLNMLYTPNKNELTVMVNQMLLHNDQFEEITVNDLYTGNVPDSVLTASRDYFGWTLQELQELSGNFENIGLGFKIREPLDVPLAEVDNGAMDLYVEAIVERRVNDGPLQRKLQRTATFIKEESIDINSNTRVIDIEDGYYLYGENQLEVFIDGVKIVNGIDFEEGTDLSNENSVDTEGNIIEEAPRRKGAKTKQFTLLNAYHGRLTYKINTNIYSYDHINDLIDELDYNALTAVKKVEELYDQTVTIQENVQGTINELQEEIIEIKDIANGLDGKYLTSDSVISISQMPPTVVSNMVYSLDHISTSLTFNSGKLEYSVRDNIREADFLIAYKRDVLNQMDKVMIRGVDYSVYDTITNDNNYSDTILSISDSYASLMNTGDIIILTGIKFGKAGR